MGKRRKPAAKETIYKLKTATVQLKVCEAPGQVIDSKTEAVLVARAVFAKLDVDQEHFLLLVLDTKSHVRAFKVLFSGGQRQSVIDVRTVFRAALLLGAGRIIVAHNHPTGDPKPSADDRSITDRLRRAGVVIGVELLDHIIIGRDKSYSFTEAAANASP